MSNPQQIKPPAQPQGQTSPAATSPSGAPASKPVEQPRQRRYFVVNPAGAIHEVSREHARERLRQPGWRVATPDEIAKLVAAGGRQTAGAPLCARWTPDPDAQIDAMGE